MAIDNISRTNTIDEWRVQTNLSANTLNTLETGNYEKTAGTLTVSGDGAVSITANGQALQVTNGALFSSNISVGKDISLGVISAATGNLQMGGTLTVYAPDTVAPAVYVANNVLLGKNLQVTATVRSNNFLANSNVTVAGAVVADKVRANTDIVTPTLIVTGNNTSGNVTVSGDTRTNYLEVVTDADIRANLVIASNTITSHLIANNSIVADNARITANATVGGSLVATGSLVADNARIAANATFGETTANTINTTNARITGNANVASVTASGSIVADNARITANITGAHFEATGSLVADNARIAANATFGETTATTINTTNARINGNANVASVTASGSIVADNARITANANVGGSLVATGSLVADNARITANANVGGSLVATGSLVANNARIAANANVGGSLVATGSIVADNVRITSNLSIGSGNTYANGTHIVSYGGGIVVNNAIVTANASFGETTATTINTTNARITGNANVVSVTASGSIVADNLRATANAKLDKVTVTGASHLESTLNVSGAATLESSLSVATTVSSVGNATFGNVTTANAVSAGILRTTGNATFGNVTTANAVSAGTLRTTGAASIGGTLTASSGTISNDLSVTGKLSVGGDFVLTGDIVYDTDSLIISTVTPVTTTGEAYYGVFRGNTSGSINGANVNASGTVSDANAYIRWSSTANNWQIRDVFNADTSTSYSKILTANLISSSLTSTSTGTFLSSSGANTLNDRIVTANTNLKSYVDTANTNLKNYVDTTVGTANTNLKNYVDTTVGTANTNLKNYADSTFLKLTGGTVSGDVTFSKNVTISGTVTYINTTELNIGDNEIVLNSDVSGSTNPTQNAGIIINRGSNTNTYIRWNEDTDKWVFRDNIAEYIIASTSDVSTANTNLKSYIDTRTTSNISEGTNLYLTSSRVRSNVSNSGPINYDNSNGVFSHADSGVTATGYGSSTSVPVFVVNATGHITSVSNTTIRSGTTTVTGIVSLTDSVTSTSTTTAATPASVKKAYDHANNAFAAANASTQLAFKTISANGTDVVADSANDTLTLTAAVANGIFVNANATTDTIDIGLRDIITGVSVGSTTSVSRFTVDAKGRITSANSVAIAFPAEADTLATVTGRGSTTATAISLTNSTASVNTTTGALIVTGGVGVGGNVYASSVYDGTRRTLTTVSNTSPISATVSANTISISHENSGVTATGYGSSTSVPVFVVNATGHITSVSNTTIRSASTTQTGIIQLSTATNSSNTTTAPTSSALKVTYDFASGAFTKANSAYGHASAAFTKANSAYGHADNAFAKANTLFNTTANASMYSLGVGTAASGNTGEILATGDITTSYSDDRLKIKLGSIENALDKVMALTGFYYEANETAQNLGYEKTRQVGVSAQEVQSVLPEVVTNAPIDDKYLTVKYERIVPLLIEAIKEIKTEIDILKGLK